MMDKRSINYVRLEPCPQEVYSQVGIWAHEQDKGMKRKETDKRRILVDLLFLLHVCSYCL
jgi:hypothetical protein